MIKMCGARPLIVSTTREQGFRLTAEHLEAALSLATSPKWIVLNAPGNPSRALYSREQLLAIAEVLRRYPRVMGAIR